MSVGFIAFRAAINNSLKINLFIVAQKCPVQLKSMNSQKFRKTKKKYILKIYYSDQNK